jgi:hypothetical protein
MRRRLLYTCKCGRWVKGRNRVCSFCSSNSKETVDNIENPTFLLTNEIAEHNINIRLREGFKLLNDMG